MILFLLSEEMETGHLKCSNCGMMLAESYEAKGPDLITRRKLRIKGKIYPSNQQSKILLEDVVRDHVEKCNKCNNETRSKERS